MSDDSKTVEGELVEAEAVDRGREEEAAFRRQQLTRKQMLAEIDQVYGDGNPFDGDRLTERGRVIFSQAKNLLIEGGRVLILLKEHEGYGRWLERLEYMGIDPSFAAKCMKTSERLADGTRRVIAERLNQTKVFALLAEDDDTLDALAEGGTVAGLTLDAIDKMSAREVRNALRKSREERTELQQLQDRLLADKDAKINDLHKRLMKAEQRSLLGDQQAELDAAEVGRDIALSTQRVLDALFGVERLVLALAERELPVHLGEALAGNLQRITDHLDRVREIGAAVIPDDGGPDDAGWVRELADDDDVSGGA